jgi:uncharacterized protein YlxW (UPF0749 family)
VLDSQRLPRRQLAIFIVVIVALGFLFTIQVRSQATAAKLLSGQDNVTLALLINGLAQSNQQLVQTRYDLTAQEQKLQSDADANRSGVPALQDDLNLLQVFDGSVPVHGPGITMHIGFSLQPFELQDLGNSLRQLGAEALSVNNHRLTARSAIRAKGNDLVVDGQTLSAPFDVQAVGDPSKLSVGGASIVGTLKARGNVSLATAPDIHISAISPQRPEVYSSFSH